MDRETGDRDTVGRDAVAENVDFGFFHGDKIVNIGRRDFPKPMRVNIGDVEKNREMGEGVGGNEGGSPVGGGYDETFMGLSELAKAVNVFLVKDMFEKMDWFKEVGRN